MSEESAVAAVLVGLNDEKEPHGDSKHELDDKNRHSSLKKPGRRPKQSEPQFPIAPRIIQVIKKPKTHMNHSYRDFSGVPPETDYEFPKTIEEMTFAQKVHHILSQEKNKKIITWMPHGRAFKVLVPKLMESEHILQKYFGHNRYSSFLRQLNNHDFKHITHGLDRNCYYHEFMLRGLPHLARYMPEPRDARRLIPCPGDEPDLYQISTLFPLPTTEKRDNGPQQSGLSGAARLSSELDTGGWQTATSRPCKVPRTTMQTASSPLALSITSPHQSSYSLTPSPQPPALPFSPPRPTPFSLSSSSQQSPLFLAPQHQHQRMMLDTSMAQFALQREQQLQQQQELQWATTAVPQVGAIAAYLKSMGAPPVSSVTPCIPQPPHFTF